MPAIHEYVIKQEREFRIRATDPHQAAALAEYVFDGNINALQSVDFGTNQMPEIRVTSLTVEEEY